MNRDRQKRWDVENLCTASTKLREEEYAALRRACDAAHTTVYAQVKRLLRQWMSAAETASAADAERFGAR